MSTVSNGALESNLIIAVHAGASVWDSRPRLSEGATAEGGCLTDDESLRGVAEYRSFEGQDAAGFVR